MFGRIVAGVPKILSRAAPLPTVLLALMASGAPAQTFTVNTTSDADDGACTVAHCSLREAIQAANGVPDAAVAFAIPGAGPHTIRPTGPLPTVIGPMTIDGTTEPDFAGTPVVELDGTLAGASSGLTVGGSGNTIRGLVVNRFQINGISLESGSSGNRIEGCLIGLDVSGTLARGNGNAGVLVGQSADNVIGGATTAERNVISGNAEGVTIVDLTATANRVLGNYIGTDVTGTVAVPNDTGVLLLAPHNSVGGGNPGEGNVISGNTHNGVDLGPPNATNNVVAGNYIGTDAFGAAPLGNDVGVWVNDVADNVIGGENAGARNVISGHPGAGVLITGPGASGNVIQGNYIGTNTSGDAAIANDTGILLLAPGTQVGGVEAGAGNVVSGNTGYGIDVGEGNSGTIIEGNRIGTDATGSFAVGNEVGIWLNGTVGARVGGSAPGAGNVISGNVLHGMRIRGATDCRVQGNRIGVGVDGGPLGNLGWGIHVYRGSLDNLIGGPDAGAGNVIAHNGSDGILVRGEETAGIEIRGNAIHDNGELGIDHVPDGVGDNDPGDVDEGPNGLLNHPVAMGVPTGSGVMAKALMFDGLPDEPYTVEFFGNAACDPSGYGEGEVSLGTTQITSAGDGDASIAIPVASTTHLTATVTDGSGNTSEFGACVGLTDFALAVTPSTRAISAGSTASYTVSVSAVGGPFSDAVELECSGGPAGSTCDFVEPELIPGETSATTTMTVTTASALRASPSGPLAWSLLLAVGLVFALLRPERRRRIPLVVLLALGALGPLACGDDGTGPEEPGPVTYQLQVTGEWEGITHGGAATLIVN